jgi:general secretion pathway protein I
MVAIAILALSLTAIFASEAGAVKMSQRARKMGLATLLVRCKMGEIEEQMASEGLPAVFDSGSDKCCEDGEIDGYTCDWEIVPVTLPDNMFVEDDDDKDSNGNDDGDKKQGPLDKITSALGLPTGEPGQKPSMEGVDPSQLLSGGGGGLASMALQYTYPVLKPSFESQIRRATVTVHWKEGTVAHEFDVTQYLVADKPIANPDDQQNGTDTGTGTRTGTGTGTGITPGNGPGSGFLFGAPPPGGGG